MVTVSVLIEFSCGETWRYLNPPFPRVGDSNWCEDHGPVTVIRTTPKEGDT